MLHYGRSNFIPQHSGKQCYPSDPTRPERRHSKPSTAQVKCDGNGRLNMRQVVNGVMYAPSGGRQRRYIPKDSPSMSAVHAYFGRWKYDCVLERAHDILYAMCR